MTNQLSEIWKNIIETSDKSFFTFEKSAHFPNGEEPEKFVQIVRQIALGLGNITNG